MQRSYPPRSPLAGVQMNLAGIVGPGSRPVVLLPWTGAPLLISINASMFLLVAVAVSAMEAPPDGDSTDAPRKLHRVISSVRCATRTIRRA